MKTILVPTDFSPAAYNAAHYAIGLAAQLNISKIVLYNVYQQYISEDPMMIGFVSQDVTELKKISEDGLAHMHEVLQQDISSPVEIESQTKIIGESLARFKKNLSGTVALKLPSYHLSHSTTILLIKL